jgi:hypothetical protein
VSDFPRVAVLQGTSPGVVQAGNINISGVVLASRIVAGATASGADFEVNKSVVGSVGMSIQNTSSNAGAYSQVELKDDLGTHGLRFSVSSSGAATPSQPDLSAFGTGTTLRLGTTSGNALTLDGLNATFSGNVVVSPVSGRFAQGASVLSRVGFYGYPEFNESGQNVYGLLYQGYCKGSNSYYYNFESQPILDGSTVLDTLKIVSVTGAYIPSGSPTVTTAYSLYVGPPNVGTTRWTVYSLSGDNYFGGNVGIGGNIGVGTTPTATATITTSISFATTGTWLTANNFTVTATAADASVGRQAAGFNAAATHTSGTLNSLYGLSGSISASGSGGTTTYAYGLRSTLAVSSGAAIGTSYGFYVANGTGAGTLTNQYGVYIENLTMGGTSNYSVYTGTAPSYFGGKVTIGGVAPEANFALTIQGASGPIYGFHVIGGDGVATVCQIDAYSGGAVTPYPYLIFRGARGSKASPSAVKTNDYLGLFSGRGYKATTWGGDGCWMSWNAAEDWDDTHTGTRIGFVTTTIGSTAAYGRMAIDSNGVGIGTNFVASYPLHVADLAKFDSGVGVGIAPSSTALLQSYKSAGTTGGEILGGQFSAARTDSEGSANCIGVRCSGLGYFDGTNQTIGNIIALYAKTEVSGGGSGGTAGTTTGLIIDRVVGTGVTNTTSYGIYINDATGSGTLTNQYGIYIGAFSKAGTLNIPVAVAGDANGGYIGLVQTATELLTVAAAASSTTAANLLPANAIILAVTCYVTVTIPTATTFTLAANTDASFTFTGSVSTASGSSSPGVTHWTNPGRLFSSAAQKVKLTPNSTPGNSNGRVRITVYYILPVAPTS